MRVAIVGAGAIGLWVAGKIARKCLIQLSYAIGIARPISIYLKTDQQSNVDIEKVIKIINSYIDLSPRGIKNYLELDKPIYEPTSTYGHFGRDFNSKTGFFSWEKLDLAKKISNPFG